MEPQEILWNDLGKPAMDKFIARSKTNLLWVGLVGICFLGIWFLKYF